MRNYPVFIFVLLLSLVCVRAHALGRGGWGEPAGGWTFVEEWNDPSHIPPPEGPGEELALWVHDNGSDEYNGTLNSAALAAAGWTGGDVVRLDTVVGAGDTEDGVAPAADATVLTLIDLGDPRDGTPALSDPSGRKITFQHILLNSDGTAISRPFVNGGVTILFRYRVFNTSEGDGIEDGTGNPVDLDTLTFVEENSDRMPIGIGYVDLGPDPTEGSYNFGLASGYYQDQTLNILGNDTVDPDGDENPILANPIDATQFHSVWLTGEVLDPVGAPHAISVKGYVDGSLVPAFDGIIFRESDPSVTDGPSPEDDGSTGVVNTHTEQTAIGLGSSGTGVTASYQYDYVCVNPFQAIAPQSAVPPVPATSIQDWALYD